MSLTKGSQQFEVDHKENLWLQKDFKLVKAPRGIFSSKSCQLSPKGNLTFSIDGLCIKRTVSNDGFDLIHCHILDLGHSALERHPNIMTGRPFLSTGVLNPGPKLQSHPCHSNIVLKGSIVGKFSGQFNFVSFGGWFRRRIKTLDTPALLLEALGISSVRVSGRKAN